MSLDPNLELTFQGPQQCLRKLEKKTKRHKFLPKILSKADISTPSIGKILIFPFKKYLGDPLLKKFWRYV
jgi:hypothetical protein